MCVVFVDVFVVVLFLWSAVLSEEFFYARALKTSERVSKKIRVEFLLHFTGCILNLTKLYFFTSTW